MRLTPVLLALSLSAAPIWAQEAQTRQIIVTGVGEVAVVPDMAVITLGVSEQDKSAAAAMRATSDSAAAILARLSENGIDARDVQTSDVSLNPVWNNRSSGMSSDSEPKIVGYTANNRITVRVRDLDSLGSLMDAVLEDGANRFNGLRFAVQEPRPHQDAARQEAVADAMEKAKLYSEAAGVTLGPILTMSELGMSSGPAPMVEMSMARDSGVPIAAGEQEISARLTVVFGIAD